jgi:hypothetical protein
MSEWPTSQKYEKGCTSNAVRVIDVSILALFDKDDDDAEILPIDEVYSCTEGHALSVDFTATIDNNSGTARFDAAIWFSLVGDALNDETCTIAQFLADGSLGDEEEADEFDNCGDLAPGPEHYADICDLPIMCVGDTQVEVESCTSYKMPGANTVCEDDPGVPESLLPGSPSKCKCETLTFAINICTFDFACKDLQTIPAQCAGDTPPDVLEDWGDVFEDVAVGGSNTCGELVFDDPAPFDSEDAGSGVITRTYTLHDDVGSLECTEVITPVDDTAPEFTLCPADECVNICDNPDIAEATANVDDNCDGPTTGVPLDSCTFDSTGITRVWKHTDAAGNEAEQCTQVIDFDCT